MKSLLCLASLLALSFALPGYAEIKNPELKIVKSGGVVAYCSKPEHVGKYKFGAWSLKDWTAQLDDNDNFVLDSTLWIGNCARYSTGKYYWDTDVDAYPVVNKKIKYWENGRIVDIIVRHEILKRTIVILNDNYKKMTQFDLPGAPDSENLNIQNAEFETQIKTALMKIVTQSQKDKAAGGAPIHTRIQIVQTAIKKVTNTYTGYKFQRKVYQGSYYFQFEVHEDSNGDLKISDLEIIQ